MVPSTLQASVCDEQLMNAGGEIALSGNKEEKRKKNKYTKQKTIRVLLAKNFLIFLIVCHCLPLLAIFCHCLSF